MRNNKPTQTPRANTDSLLLLIRGKSPMTLRQQLHLTVLLSIPAIVAQFSSIAMQYIDASMVGSLGAEASASIGLVSTSTWLFSGLCSAAATGFSVQVAHAIGANDPERAKSVLRQAFMAIGMFSLLLAATGTSISGVLPSWLGGDPSIRRDASLYFLIYALSLPALQFHILGSGMLRCSGNMKVPSILNVMMCVQDVIYNFFFIFPSREISTFGIDFWVPGAGLGVVGAALGTMLAEVVTAILMITYLCTRSSALKLTGTHGHFRPTRNTIRQAAAIGFPMGVEHALICGAQIMTTVIVAPLGIFAIAANSFAITAESLCYMPGYGIAEAATTLTGQSLGAGRKELALRFARITVWLGMAVMGLMGVVMYVGAPQIIGVMTPLEDTPSPGINTLPLHASPAPLHAAAIIAYGVFVGAGRTLVPSLMNLFSIWAVRLTMAAAMAPSMGLKGVWLAMCIELCFRGCIFLIRLERKKWMK